jgi:hypothetical protein
MSEAVTAIESSSGKGVMLLAPSSPSVEVLRAQRFARANTLQQFELNPELQQAVKGQVLWVDEAGFFVEFHRMAKRLCGAIGFSRAWSLRVLRS